MVYNYYFPWTADGEFRSLVELYYRNMYFVQFYWEDEFKFTVDRTGGVDFSNRENFFRAYLDYVFCLLKHPETTQSALVELKNLNNEFPHNTKVLDTLGVVYYLQKKYHEALDYFKQALIIVPDNKDILTHLRQAETAISRMTESV
jgi:tetratricopeptide (TPR) repeat protein